MAEFNKLDMQSKDVISDNVNKISTLFPNCVTEGKIDFNVLKQELSNDIVEDGKEKYQLTWAGKAEAKINANTPINKTLRPLKEKSVDFDNTKNIYIEGDNLEVLKILQESYLNKIKCIYIDPPYNTGNDLIYSDKFINDDELEESGQIDEYNNRLISNAESNGKFHSDWITMMYPRLKLARNLLKDNGVIFISIGQEEIHDLICLCNEIFGESNKAGIISRQMKSGGNQGKCFTKNIDYILVYSKKIECLTDFREPLEESYIKEIYNHVQKDGNRKGEKYRLMGLYQAGLGEYRPNQKYFITTPDGSKVLPPCSVQDEIMREGDGRWRWSKDRFYSELELGNIEFVETNTSPLVDQYGNRSKWNVYTKIWLTDRQEEGKIPSDLITKYENRHSSLELKKLNIDFTFAKPTELIKTLLTYIDTLDSEYVLDFFSGSASTAEAMLKYNIENKKNCKFILVQLPEKVNYEFETICDIGEERIRRSGQKIKDETNANIDYGFRVYKVDSSNMKDVYYAPTELQQAQLNMFESNIKEDRTAEDLLTQVILDLGLTLDLKIEERKVLDNNVYYVEENSLVACFDSTIDINIIDEICKCNPLKIVFKESSFKTDSDKINTFERIKKLSNDTEINII